MKACIKAWVVEYESGEVCLRIQVYAVVAIHDTLFDLKGGV